MARIVCQVLHRANRVTFVWSDGVTSFEPYALEGSELHHLLDMGTQNLLRLGEGTSAPELGHRLYRALFRLDAPDPGPAAAVHAWLMDRIKDGAVDTIEFLSNQPGLISWNTLTEDPSGDAGGFWGVRFNLAAGRRVNILRQNPFQINPTMMLAADSELLNRLTDAQRASIDQMRQNSKVLHDAASLADHVKSAAPDVLLLLVGFTEDRLRLGSDTFSVDDLQHWLQEPREGNPDPLIILMGCQEPAAGGIWGWVIHEASAKFGGLVANEILLPAERAFSVGASLAQRFLQGSKSVGAALQDLRRELGAAALTFSAFCPPDLRVVTEPPALEAAEAAPLPERPYRPFAAYEAGDRALFFGRENDVLEGALLLDREGTHAMFLHGAPGVGKTSYLQAGLLPFLETESVGYLVLRDRSPLDAPVEEKDYPPLILRATSDLAGQFADALSVFCAQPYKYTTPAGREISLDLPTILQRAVIESANSAPVAAASTSIQADTTSAIRAGTGQGEAGEELSAQDLWVALRDDRRTLARALEAITRALPFELVIVVDQGEELVALVQSAQQRERRAKALAMLTELAAAAARCKLIFTVRSQSVAALTSFFPGGVLPASWRGYQLEPLSPTQMADALSWPTNREAIPYAADVPHERYGFAFEDGMAQQIVAEVNDAAEDEQLAPLSMLQAVGALLYEKQVLGKKHSLLRMADLKDVGGVKAALTACLDSTLEKLKLLKPAQRALRGLISKLHVSHTDGSVSRDLVPASELPRQWSGSPEPVGPIVQKAADEAGLFEIQQLMIGGRPEVYVSLSQDSLARLGKKLDGERTLEAYGRGRIVDTLWIMIPFAFLCAVLSWFMTRQFGLGAGTGEDVKDPKKKSDEVAEQIRVAYASQTRRPLYFGLIARADQALRSDNALRARQILREEPASRNYVEDTKDFRDLFRDLRGFEWRYLWKCLHSERFHLQGHRGPIGAVAVAPDGKRAASAGSRTDLKGDDASIRVWNLETGELLARLWGAKAKVHALAFAPDGKTLASAGADKVVRLWDVSNLPKDVALIEKETSTLSGHADAVHGLVWGKDEKSLITVGADKAVIIWDVATAKARHTLNEHGAAVHAVAIAADGQTLVTGDADGQVIVWDADTGKKRQTIKTAFRSIHAITIAPDGKSLAAGGVETRFDTDVGSIRFFNVGDGKEARAAIAHANGIHALVYHPDGDLVVSGGTDFIVRAWSIKTGNEERKWVGHYGAITSLAFARGGAALVSGSVDAQVKVWNPEQSSGAEVIRAHADWVQALALHHKNQLLASGGRDGSVKLWDPATAKLVLKLPDLKGAVTALAFSSHKDKVFLAAATRDDKNEGAIKIWQIDGDAKQGYKAVDRHDLKGHGKGVTSLAFHPHDENADLLLSGGADQTVKLWMIDTGKEKATHKLHKDEVRCVAFTFDGRNYASGGKDGVVGIYDLDHPEQSWTMNDLNQAAIEAFAQRPPFGKDREEPLLGMVTAGADRSLSIWAYLKLDGGKTQTKEFASARLHGQPISALLFSGGYLVTASWDKTIKLLDANGGERYAFHGHTDAVRALALAADQSFLASAANDGTIRIWRAAPLNP